MSVGGRLVGGYVKYCVFMKMSLGGCMLVGVGGEVCNWALVGG